MPSATSPFGRWCLTSVLGIVLGVGWVMLTGAVVARSYGVGLGAAVVGMRMLRDGIGVPLGGVILMLMPAAIVRALRPPTRESLDGFMIGVLGALAFAAAATLTRLAPQFGTGVVSKRPMESLLVEAGIRGVAVPLVARGRRRIDRRGTVVHPAAEQEGPAPGCRALRSGRCSRQPCWRCI